MTHQDTHGPGTTVRAVVDGDAEMLRSLAVENGLFGPDELGGFDQMLAGYLDGSLDQHSWLALETHDGRLLGAAYFAPEPFGDRVWNLYFIAVAADQHGLGAGSSLVSHVEEELRGRGDEVARVLIVETSSQDGYEQARGFYRRHGFEEEARVREFYGPGDHKVIFWKLLVSETET